MCCDEPQMPHGAGQSLDSWPIASQLKHLEVLMPARRGAEGREPVCVEREVEVGEGV